MFWLPAYCRLLNFTNGRYGVANSQSSMTGLARVLTIVDRRKLADIRKCDSGELTLRQAQLEIEHFWAGALRRAVVDGDIENGSVMAGQSVGMVKKIEPCADIITELVEQTMAALALQARN